MEGGVNLHGRRSELIHTEGGVNLQGSRSELIRKEE